MKNIVLSVLALFIIFGWGSIAHAVDPDGSIEVAPNSFTPNTAISSGDMNSNFQHITDNAADITHTHGIYSSTTHTHDYSSATHTHSTYSPTTHTHDYSSATHTHSNSGTTKYGNNGTTSCDEYCAGSTWGGWSGGCIAAKDDSGAYRPCSEITQVSMVCLCTIF